MCEISWFRVSQLFHPLMLLRSEQHDIWAHPWSQKALALADAIRIFQQSGMVSRGNLICFVLEMECLEQSK